MTTPQDSQSSVVLVQMRGYRPDPDGPEVMETREQRAARVLADEQLVTLKGVAAIIGRGHQRARELNMYASQARALLADPDTPDDVRADAEEYLLTALPAPEPDPEGQFRQPFFKAGKIYAWGRRADPPRLDEWYEPIGVDSPGRPAIGARRPTVTRHRRSFADQLALLARVPVDAAQRSRIEPLLEPAFLACRAEGLRIPAARDKAVEDVASATGIDAQVVRKVMLEQAQRERAEKRGQ